MNTNFLECFLVAAEELNFTRAAERLHLSQQSLSYQIQRLEEEYHIALFERSPAVRLTLAGQDMVFYARQILQLDSQLRANFADISSFCRGRIRLGIARLRSTTVFPAIYKAYHSKWGNIDFHLIDGISSEMAQMLENNELDAYVGFLPINKPAFHSIDVGTEQLICCMNRDYFQQQFQELFLHQLKAGVDLKDICQFPLCLFPGNSTLRISIDQYLFTNHLKPNITFESAAQDVILQICKDSPVLGILTNTAYYHYVHAGQIDSNNLIAIPIRNPETTFQIYLVHQASGRHPQYLQDFFSIAANQFCQYSLSVQDYLQQGLQKIL